MRFRGCLALMLLIGVGVGGGSAHAQSSQGGMRGIVKDATGVLPNTVVMLVNEQTGVSKQTFTNRSGEYAFPVVDPGSYQIIAALTGYRTFERSGASVNLRAFQCTTTGCATCAAKRSRTASAASARVIPPTWTPAIRTPSAIRSACRES